MMNSKQYEELCRYFLADKLRISIEEIQSICILNPRRPGLPEYKHQIDLYWETDNEVTLYLNIANAKWRSSEKVDQPEVLLLQQVKLKVGAHKAVMLTNTGFTAGAKAAAQDEGIALHIVQPNFDYTVLPQKNANTIQARIQEIAANNATKPIYLHQMEYRAFELIDTKPSSLTPEGGRPSATTRQAAMYSTKVVRDHSTRAGGGYSHKGNISRDRRHGGSNNQRDGCATKIVNSGSRN